MHEHLEDIHTYIIHIKYLKMNYGLRLVELETGKIYDFEDLRYEICSCSAKWERLCITLMSWCVFIEDHLSNSHLTHWHVVVLVQLNIETVTGTLLKDSLFKFSDRIFCLCKEVWISNIEQSKVPLTLLLIFTCKCYFSILQNIRNLPI